MKDALPFITIMTVMILVLGVISVAMVYETRLDNAAVVACVEAGANPLECASAVDD